MKSLQKTNKSKSKSKSKNSNSDFPSFQTDIVIDDQGEIGISFVGPELLHILKREVRPVSNREWSLPKLPLLNSDDIFAIREEYRACRLCPKSCGTDRVQQSHVHCGDWNLKVANYGLSYGDEKEVSNGGGSGIIFLSGCPLTCPSCINPEKVRDRDSNTSIENVLKMCEALYLRGANNIQFLSPTVHLPHLLYLFKILKEHSFPLPIILKSSGYESVSEIKKFRGLVDIYLPDYKFYQNDFWQKRSGAKHYHEIFLECLKEMHNQTGPVVYNDLGNIIKGTIVRHVKNPYLKNDERKAINSFLASLSPDIMVSVMDNFIVLE